MVKTKSWILQENNSQDHLLIKQVHLRATSAFLILPFFLPSSPALAQWNYDPAQSAATAYCAARASGKSHAQAEKASNRTIASALSSGSLGSQLGTVLGGASQVIQSSNYLIQKMCPGLYGGHGGVELPSSGDTCQENSWLPACGGPRWGQE
jgi:hypothetical protein